LHWLSFKEIDLVPIIKINLLPPEEVAKIKATSRLVVVGTTGTIVGVLFFSLFLGVNIKTIALNRTLTAQKKELEKYRPIIEKWESIKRLKEDLKKKINLRNRLRKKQAFYPTLLAELNDQIPKTVWLSALKITNSNVNMNGYALANADVFTLLTNLNSLPYLNQINLEYTQSGEVEGKQIITFRITCSIRQ
jgi:Tfp pilus assembly protein PilN